MSSLAASRVLLDNGYEPVFQLTCRDRNSIALQSDLMGASALGIRNLLCLTGDPVKAGDNPNAKSVFEIESVKLLEIVGKLQQGRDGSGQKMNASTKFFPGAVVNPTLSSQGQLLRMQKKIEAGACFFQTQANYDLDDFHNFLLEAAKLGSPVLAGVLVLHSSEIARYIHSNIPGIRMPESVLERFARGPGGEAEEETGIELAVETMARLEGVCQGFHVMSVRYEEIIPRVLERYYERRKTSQDAPTPMSSTARR